MQRTDKIAITVFTILVVCVILGQVLLGASPYERTISAERDGDKAVYEIDTNIYSDYAAMVLASDIDYSLDSYVICYDDLRPWFASSDRINGAITYLIESLERNGRTASVLNVDDISSLMEKDISSDSFRTGVIFVTGSLPNEIYNGTTGIIFDWLAGGGVMYWGNGPLGKYVSIAGEESLKVVEDHDTLFFGKEDITRDEKSSVFDRRIEYEGLADIMCMLFNECTYGVNSSLLENSLDFGFNYRSYQSVTLTKYHDGNGMMVVFGGDITVDTALYAAQVIVSGINYSTSLYDFERGQAKSVKGELELSPDGINTVFVYTGSVQGLFGRTFVLN